MGPVSGFSLGVQSRGSVASAFCLRSGLGFDLWFGLVDGVRVSVEKEEW